MSPLVIGAVSALLALVAALGVGYKLGRGVCVDQVAELQTVVRDGQKLAEKAKDDVTKAQARIDALAEQMRSATPSPQVVYLEKEVKVYEPAKPLPAGACADARWAGMYNALTGSSRAAPSASRSAGVADAFAATAADSDGYVSARAFREWAADAAKQYRAAVKRDHDWCLFVQTIPGVAPFSCLDGVVPP